MFTNWLTGTSSGSATAASNSAESTSAAAAAAAAAATLASNASAGGIMSTPPDVVLEVGPAASSGSVRFVAHSIVLGMHSGYLRSAIRLDENVIVAAAAGGSGSASGELVLYLSNVTAEQFAPLLTYMYTGFLDLNVENIFGVLLATHVLHMPRALEICRSFLARAQTEGYLGNSLPSIAAAAANGSPSNSGKVIRPIPSKATLPNFGFLTTAPPPPPPHPAPAMHAHQLSLPAATSASNNAAYKSLQQAYATPMIISESARECREDISIELSPTRDTGGGSGADEDDDNEDEEVFIDSSSNSATDDAEMEIDCTISVTSDSSTAAARANLTAARNARQESAAKSERYELLVAEKPTLLREEKRTTPAAIRAGRNTTNAPPPNTKRRSGGSGGVRRKQEITQRHKAGAQGVAAKTAAASGTASGGGLQVAKAPIPASQLPDVTEGGPKFIVDVASCDGPVRFRRILNTAYGHKPEAYASAAVLPERTQQSVSLSFHQQMAKTISQQRQLQHADESENSESSGGGGGGVGGSNGGKSSKPHASNEIYVCVYCKHTFKSQYCYQKHAKRHLNPLTLNCTSTSGSGASGGSAAESREKLEIASGGGSGSRSSYRLPPSTLPTVGGGGVGGKQQNASELLLRREVRPLDMNVQYYPCKTCGSKFPSYYFVHKHRKMCHADEEAAAAATADTSKPAPEGEEGKEGGSGGGSSTAKPLD